MSRRVYLDTSTLQNLRNRRPADDFHGQEPCQRSEGLLLGTLAGARWPARVPGQGAAGRGAQPAHSRLLGYVHSQVGAGSLGSYYRKATILGQRRRPLGTRRLAGCRMR